VPEAHHVLPWSQGGRTVLGNLVLLHPSCHDRITAADAEIRLAAAMTASPYDEPLSALRENTENLATWIAIWEAREEPDAHARRCANDAMDAIYAMLRDLHTVRARLVGEIRHADDATAQRADAMLRGERSVR
jgi:hypothetical protein